MLDIMTLEEISVFLVMHKIYSARQSKYIQGWYDEYLRDEILQKRLYAFLDKDERDFHKSLDAHERDLWLTYFSKEIFTGYDSENCYLLKHEGCLIIRVQKDRKCYLQAPSVLLHYLQYPYLGTATETVDLTAYVKQYTGIRLLNHLEGRDRIVELP